MRVILLFLFLSTCLTAVRSQETAQLADPGFPQILFNARFQMGVPLGVFSDRLDDELAVGGGGALLFPLGNKPLWVGFDVSWMQFDHETLEYTELIDGLQIPFSWRASNNLLMYYGFLRYKPQVNLPVQPYLEGWIGWNRFYTRSVITDEDLDEVVETDREHKDWTIGYGGAAGLEIILSYEFGIALDLRALYLRSSAVDFYGRRSPEPATFDDPLEVFELRNSSASMILPMIGVTVLLNTLPD